MDPLQIGLLKLFKQTSKFKSEAALAQSPPPRFRHLCNLMIYQNRLETNLLQPFTEPFTESENSEWFSVISGVGFEVNIVDEQKQA